MICAECGQSFENEIDAVIQNHEPCATKHGTQPTDTQQLQAKIAEEMYSLSGADIDMPKSVRLKIRKWYRQLSAVQ